MSRLITTHQVNGLNKALTIEVLDKPGQGNACHHYMVSWLKDSKPYSYTFKTSIEFQNGLINEVGVNGLSNTALLAIVRDRLEGFQSGIYACSENQEALDSIVSAMESLASRTRKRVSLGIERTSQV